MLIKHIVKHALPLKGKLHIPDALGGAVSHRLKSGALLNCTFQSPDGEQFELEGRVAFELINYKGRVEHLERIGGSLIFGERPGGQIPLGWLLFVLVDE
ncbi:hypothetical protein [Jeongeupia naejangsanensis]|uniref:PilZ domain-containing protein n=1 Tax=Jeongeupia naejangsanensis TaxID=613195 RepID=A0ABS2BKE3_9NEIS|nr:hypothetical protein [Jeongeupia naejangsanensis]MBM3116079.1 hypothetical protein [Jeongeupia naejangsanensis]